MNLRILRISIGKLWLLAILLAPLLLTSGCASFGKSTVILTDKEAYYFIPAGTPFKARIVKDGPLVEVTRDRDSYNLDAGYLAELQETANARVLQK